MPLHARTNTNTNTNTQAHKHTHTHTLPLCVLLQYVSCAGLEMEVTGVGNVDFLLFDVNKHTHTLAGEPAGQKRIHLSHTHR